MTTQKDRQGIWMLVGVALVLAAAMGVKATLGNKPRPDAANCIGSPDTMTVLVLDLSERVSAQTQDEIHSRALKFAVDSTRQNELVSVFTVSDLSKNALAPLLSLCRPQAFGSGIVENVQMIKKRFRDRFEAPLDSALRVQPGNTAESPIAQALVDISRTRYLRGKKNTLIVFSDMLENTSAFTLYQCENPNDLIDRFRASRRGGVERPTFQNTRVVLNIIPRFGQSASSLKCRDKLWVWFFGDNVGGDARVEVDYLPGGTPAGDPPAGAAAR